jgi:antitoxin (DNA-binding transcriptional repressor) of toxin-antitoxin stability system
VEVTKSVTVAELGEHLQEYFAEVQHGTTIDVVIDGSTIARISPAVYYPKSRKRLADIDPGPRPPNLKTDPAEIIIEERERRRSGDKYK